MQDWYDDHDPWDYYEPEPDELPQDEAEIDATEILRGFFEENCEKVFYSRQPHCFLEPGRPDLGNLPG